MGIFGRREGGSRNGKPDQNGKIKKNKVQRLDFGGKTALRERAREERFGGKDEYRELELERWGVKE